MRPIFHDPTASALIILVIPIVLVWLIGRRWSYMGSPSYVFDKSYHMHKSHMKLSILGMHAFASMIVGIIPVSIVRNNIPAFKLLYDGDYEFRIPFYFGVMCVIMLLSIPIVEAILVSMFPKYAEWKKNRNNPEWEQPDHTQEPEP